MADKKKVSHPVQVEPLVSPNAVNEYLKLEASVRWMKNFEGSVAESEPHVWGWVQRMCKTEIEHFAREMPEAFTHPFMAAAMRPQMLRFFLRGYFMGMRKYEKNLESLFTLVPMPMDTNQGKKKVKADDPPSVLENEIDISDLEDPI